MFHITPDDTETSAVWVTCRIPDPPCPRDPDFMFSDNIFDVAKSNSLLVPSPP